MTDQEMNYEEYETEDKGEGLVGEITLAEPATADDASAANAEQEKAAADQAWMAENAEKTSLTQTNLSGFSAGFPDGLILRCGETDTQTMPLLMSCVADREAKAKEWSRNRK